MFSIILLFDCASVKNVRYVLITRVGYMLYDAQFPSIASQCLPDNPCAMYVAQTVDAWSKPLARFFVDTQ